LIVTAEEIDEALERTDAVLQSIDPPAG